MITVKNLLFFPRIIYMIINSKYKALISKKIVTIKRWLNLPPSFDNKSRQF